VRTVTLTTFNRKGDMYNGTDESVLREVEYHVTGLYDSPVMLAWMDHDENRTIERQNVSLCFVYLGAVNHGPLAPYVVVMN
jgi:hypothetical protein